MAAVMSVLHKLVAWALLAIGAAASGQVHPFRFAWLSDTHVGSPTGAEDLEAAVRDINSRSDIAFVVLSGDVTEMGSDAELEQARAILAGLDKPWYIIPGNHDTKWSESGCTSFPRVFGNDRFVFDYGGYRFIGLHQGPVMKMGDGHFAPEDLRWLDSELARLAESAQPLVIVTHYPLDSSIDNWYALIDRIKKYNTQAVLVGHGHRNRALDFEGVPGVMGRSLLRTRDTPSGYTIVEVGPDAMRFYERTPGGPEGPAWHSVPLGARDYSADATAYPRPDFSVNDSYPDVRIRWKVDTGCTIASTPAVWKDYAVVGNAAGTVYGLSLKDGKTRWTFAAGSRVFATPAAADGRVVFGSTDGHIYCLEAAAGTLAWKVPTGAPIVGAATIDRGTVYIGGSDRTFRAIDLRTGSVKWEYKGIGGFIETKPLVYQGKVIFGAWDSSLYALNAKDGSPAWKWSGGRPGVLYSPAACWPVGAKGKVFVVAPDRYMTALDVRTGAAVWRSNRYEVREAVGVSMDGSRVYARTMNDTVVALATAAASPQALWTANCGYGYDIDPSMPVEKDGVVFFGTKNGMVYALDGRTGAVRWKYRVGVTTVHTPVPLDGKSVLVTDSDGRVMVLVERI
jgi:outer membrane protein assembly factor BamB/predicted phosphodiesterase